MAVLKESSLEETEYGTSPIKKLELNTSSINADVRQSNYQKATEAKSSTPKWFVLIGGWLWGVVKWICEQFGPTAICLISVGVGVFVFFQIPIQSHSLLFPNELIITRALANMPNIDTYRRALIIAITIIVWDKRARYRWEQSLNRKMGDRIMFAVSDGLLWPIWFGRKLHAPIKKWRKNRKNNRGK